MSCRDASAGYFVREKHCPRLTPVASVPWSTICVHGYHRERRRDASTTTPTDISLNSNDAFCGRSLRRSLQFFFVGHHDGEINSQSRPTGMQPVGKNGDFVGPAVAVSVFENADRVKARPICQSGERILGRSADPQPPHGVEGEDLASGWPIAHGVPLAA
jgi:hypothetical protein